MESIMRPVRAARLFVQDDETCGRLCGGFRDTMISRLRTYEDRLSAALEKGTCEARPEESWSAISVRRPDGGSGLAFEIDGPTPSDHSAVTVASEEEARELVSS